MTHPNDLVGAGCPPLLAGLLGFQTIAQAGAGTAQTGATALQLHTCVIGTTASSQTAFVLPANAALHGDIQFFNTSSTTALIYPESGSQINKGGANSSFSVAQNKGAHFFKTTSTDWVAILSA